MSRTFLERAALPELYVVLALLSTVFMILFVPPFLVSDEDGHSRRAYSIAHGDWLAQRTAAGIGAQVDSSLTQVATDFILVQAHEEAVYKIAASRPDGRMPLSMIAAQQPVRWSGRLAFVGFPNTAAYPPTLYLPQALGWRLTEALGFSIIHSLLCVRLLTALCSIAIGWFALRLGRVDPWLLTAYLLLPTVMGLVASCSQDSFLMTLPALAVAILSRALAERRSPLLWEWIVASILLAAIVMARPPYLPLALALYLPQLQTVGRRGVRKYLAPTLGIVFVTGALLAWQAAAPATASYQGVLPGVDAKLQMAFLVSHPLRGVFNIVAGTLSIMPHMIMNALYSLAWNDIFPPTAIYGILMLSLAGFCLAASWHGLSSWRARGLLALCVVGSILAISLAEYLIWTQVGSPKVDGPLARYYLPFVPFLLLFSSEKLRAAKVATGRGLMLSVSAALFLIVLLSPPWVLSHRLYNTGPITVLKATLR
jgi:uncharacterized membrane protein